MSPELIAAIASLIAQLGPLGLELFLKLEDRLNLGPDEKRNIANAVAASDQSDADTISRVEAWMAINGHQLVRANNRAGAVEFVPAGTDQPIGTQLVHPPTQQPQMHSGELDAGNTMGGSPVAAPVAPQVEPQK